MNKYDERYEIRLAKRDDIPLIMQFLDEHWRKGHILSRNRELFEYEFLEGDNVNFVVAIDRDTNTLEAISGFLRCSNTDDVSKRDLWGSIWKVNDSRKNMSFLGVELIRRLKELMPYRYHLGIGINPNTTLPIRKMVFHETVQKMQHHYMLNTELTEYKIAVIQKRPAVPDAVPVHDVYVKEFLSFDEYAKDFDLEAVDMIPRKDNWYIKKRFFSHPIYQYHVCGVYKDSQCTAVFVYRIQECNGSRCIRIVDVLGSYDAVGELRSCLEALLHEQQAEYMDLYQIGIRNEILESAGFAQRVDDTNVIPNYFSPFVQQNVDIWVRAENENTVFFKGDGDQDRAN